MRHSRVLFAALMMTSALAVSAETTSGRLVGVLRDEHGQIVSDATVTMRDQNTGTRIAVQTAGDGRFDFFAVLPGTYTLRAERPGFKPSEVTGIVINIGGYLVHDLTLMAGDSREVITVAAGVPLIETLSPGSGGIIEETRIATLPISGRQILNLALVLPGTSVDATRSFFASVNVGASMTFNSTAHVVDGTSNNWAEDGEPRQDFPTDSIREFRVVTAHASVEYGLATGGVVELVTRSGSNDLRGSVFEYLRDRVLNTRGVFEREKPAFRRHQFGGSLGGPILRDRLHFFLSAERTQQDDFYTVNTGLPGFYRSVEGTFRAPSFRNLFLVKLDLGATVHQSAFLRYAHEDEHTECSGCGGTVASTAGFDQDTPRRSFVFGHTWLLSQDRVNELRLQRAWGGYYISPHGVGIWKRAGDFSAARVERLQRTYIFPSLTYGSSQDDLGPEERWQVRDTFSKVWGDHFIKVGFDFNKLPYSQERTGNILGTYTFAEDQYFDPSDPAALARLHGAATFTATLPPVHTSKTTNYSAIFAQDDWTFASVALAAGVRLERFAGIANEDLDLSNYPVELPYIDVAKRRARINVGPRVGIVWDIGKQGIAILRAGYGIHHGHVRVGANLAEYRNYQQFTVNITNPAYPDPYLGRDPRDFIVSSPANLTILANDFRQPYSQTVSAGFSRRMGSDAALNVDAIYSRTLHDRKIQDLNPRNASGARALPQFGRVDEHQSSGLAKYRAVYVKAEKRFGVKHQLLASYTWTKSEDNNPLVRFLDPADHALDWGPSNAERRHALVVSGSSMLFWNVAVGAVWNFRSQLPWNAIAGRDLNRDGFNTDLVPGTTRNSGSRSLDLNAVNAWRATNGLIPIESSQIDSSRINSLDLRIAKSIASSTIVKVEVVAQMFNAFNIRNLQAQFGGGRVTNALSPLFGRIVTARPRRQTELGVRIMW